MRRCGDAERYGEMQRDAERCGDARMGRCGEMWRDAERCGEDVKMRRCGEMRKDVEMLGGQNLRGRGFIQRQNTGLESCTYAQVLFLIIINTYANVHFCKSYALMQNPFLIIICPFCRSYALMQKFFFLIIYIYAHVLLMHLCTT